MEPDWPQIRDWRKRMRAELIARREAMPAGERRAAGERITAHILAGFEALAGMTVACCWPFRAEYDARFPLRRFRERGSTTALPLVAKAAPLEFRAWWPGAPMARGVYDIPVPDGTPVVEPDAAIVPMNGFDAAGCRLGYGGGYFDRTLAALRPAPVAIGTAFEFARLDSIHPQPHDIPMDFVVTEAGVHVASGGRLERIDATGCRQRLEHLLQARGLPREARNGAPRSSPVCYAEDFPGYFGEACAPR